MNTLKVFEQANLQTFIEVANLEKQIKELEAHEKKLKDYLKEQMEINGIKSIDNEILKITFVAESESTSIDLKALKEKESDLYQELLDDYGVTKKKSAYVRFTVK